MFFADVETYIFVPKSAVTLPEQFQAPLIDTCNPIPITSLTRIYSMSDHELAAATCPRTPSSAATYVFVSDA